MKPRKSSPLHGPLATSRAGPRITHHAPCFYQLGSVPSPEEPLDARTIGGYRARIHFTGRNTSRATSPTSTPVSGTSREAGRTFVGLAIARSKHHAASSRANITAPPRYADPRPWSYVPLLMATRGALAKPSLHW